MITGFTPSPFCIIHTVTEDDKESDLQTITELGWCLLSYDESRFRKIMEALELGEMSTCKFIQQAVESYCFSIEHAACFPELRDHQSHETGKN